MELFTRIAGFLGFAKDDSVACKGTLAPKPAQDVDGVATAFPVDKFMGLNYQQNLNNQDNHSQFSYK